MRTRLPIDTQIAAAIAPRTAAGPRLLTSIADTAAGRIARAGSIGILALGAVACGAGPQTVGIEVERTDSAGVEIVLNRGADVPLDWGFEPTLRIGGADEGPESFFQLRPGTIRADADGNLYVFDMGNSRIVVFDPEGKHLRTFGRQGGGPGEILRPGGGIAIAPDGSVSVFDFGKVGFVRFDADGRPLDEWRIGVYPDGGRYEFVDGGILFQASVFNETRDGLDKHLILMTESGDSTVLAHFPPQPVRPVTFESCGIAIGGMPKLFAPAPIWAARGGRIATNVRAEYVVDLYEASRVVASVRRDLAPRPATQSLARREFDEGGWRIGILGAPGGGCTVPVDEVIAEQGVADVVPTIAEIVIAPDGTLWVRRRVSKDEEAPIDIISPDGVYLGTLPPGTPFPSDFLPDGRIAVLEQDELEVQYVVVYRVGN